MSSFIVNNFQEGEGGGLNLMTPPPRSVLPSYFTILSVIELILNKHNFCIFLGRGGINKYNGLPTKIDS